MKERIDPTKVRDALRVGWWAEYVDTQIVKSVPIPAGERFGIVAHIGTVYAYVVTNGPRPTLVQLPFEAILNPTYRRARLVEIADRLRKGKAYGITKGARKGLKAARAAVRAEIEAQKTSAEPFDIF